MKKILFALIALLGIVACEEETIVDVKQTLQLSVDNTEIYADGTQTATFTVKDDKDAVVEDATIYFADTNEVLAGYTFKTKYAGQYKFYAQKGNTKSNEITVTVNEVVENTKVVTLSVTPTTIDADGVAVATFAVKCDNEAVEATIYNAADDSALEGNTFSTSVAGEYTFYAIYEQTRSNNVKVTANEVETPDPNELVLKVDNATIDANDTAVATFYTTIGSEAVEATIYNAADDSALEGNTFSTDTPGIYTFYAKYEELTSNEVKVTARMVIEEEEKPIVIEASTDTIKANGIDFVKFTIIQDGANVTSQCNIFANGSKLNDSKFVTTTAGTYTIYATKGDLKSNELIITATAVETGKTIVFADGVSISSGWYDVNKVGQGDNGDINMCWAASTSNMLQWFQDRYMAAGNTLPPSAVNGPGATPTGGRGHLYELALMEMFYNEWDNSRGGHTNEAITWYFEGHLSGGEYATEGSQAVPKTDGGYWKSIWSDVVTNIYTGYEYIVIPGLIDYPKIYTTVWNNYYLWGNGTQLEGVERLAKFSELVVEAIEHGMASMTVNLGATLGSAAHATTLWGYEIDNATGLVTRVWITDSDDLTTSGYKEPLLNEYSVSIGEGKSHIKLSGNTRYGACYVSEILPFAGYGSAK